MRAVPVGIRRRPVHQLERGEAAAGQGLKNMRLRAKTIDGGFVLRSRPGRGTAFEVMLRA